MEKKATIAAVKSTHLEVDFATKGIEAVSWYNVCKVFSAGDFVSVTSSSSKGTMGWIERIEADTVCLLIYKEKGNISTSSDDIEVSFVLILADLTDPLTVLQWYEFHVNWLKLATIPFLHTLSTLNADDSLSKADSVPWIGTHIIIMKLGSPLKGYIGIVKDVLRGQDTASSLKVVIQQEHLNPLSPFKMVVVDYDDVVEQRSVDESSLIRVDT